MHVRIIQLFGPFPGEIVAKIGEFMMAHDVLVCDITYATSDWIQFWYIEDAFDKFDCLLTRSGMSVRNGQIQ